jgi:epidermal growth factor receptor kinase substrate 8
MGPSYELDHLATFTVGSKQGLLSPEDGIKKLRQMEMTSGIWTMRVQLVLEAQDLVIIDANSVRVNQC